MSDVLIDTLLRPGETAGKVLADEGWPKNLHQKLIDMRYNKEFRLTAKDATTKLTSPAPLHWPIVTPATYKVLKSKAVSLFKELVRLTRIREELESDMDWIWKNRTSEFEYIVARMGNWGTKYNKYKKDQEKLYDQCVKTASTCKDVKIGLRMSKRKTKEASKQLDKLQKELDKHNEGPNKGVQKQIGELRKRLKPLKAEQESLGKELLEATKLVAKLAMVMP